MECQNCQHTFLDEERIAAISGSISGDEVTDIYYLCPVCNQYTVVTWWDNFTGEETMKVSEPLPRTEGDRRIGIIRQCTRPWDKKCRCESHLDYFNNTLD